MPELPEVETTRRGLRRIARAAAIRESSCANPVCAGRCDDLPRCCAGPVRPSNAAPSTCSFTSITVPAGPSGHVRLPARAAGGHAAALHDHIDIVLASGGMLLRYNDPRRFGSFQWFAR
jgi:formamidopyrimidine-DNA glycosylase